jgi:hypothetical protein
VKLGISLEAEVIHCGGLRMNWFGMCCRERGYARAAGDADHEEWKLYRSKGRFWPVDLCCAVVRRKSANLRLVNMRSDTILPQ